MRVSLIITTYNRPDSLMLTMRSVENQVILPDEVIIADDGSSSETLQLIKGFQNSSNLTIIHSWQTDKGFRAAKSRNKAISKSSSDYIILIDGDVILHNEFIRDHINNSESGFFIQGSRVLLTEGKTKQVLNKEKVNISFISDGLQNRKSALHSNVLSKLFSNKNNYLRGIKTCNMSFYKQDCININGFNNEFNGWGREDSEFVVRLLNSGVNRKNVRFNAIQFHLWHNENTRESLDKNDAILKTTIDGKAKWCDNGLNKCI